MADAEPAPAACTGVSKSFGGIQAVHSITFDVGAGESVGLVGPNGAGKTTLFNCVCGQLRPETGDIVFDGTPLFGMPTYKRARLGHRPHLPKGGGVHRHVGARPPHGGRAVPAGRGPAVAGPAQHEQADAGRDGAGRGHAGAGRDHPPGRHVGQRARVWATAGWSSWPGPWRPSRRSCWPTSRPPGSTCTRRPRWPRCSAPSSVSGARPCSWSSTTSPWWPRWSTGPSSWISVRCWPKAPSTR